MRISIITVCFNSAKTIAETLASVAAQLHPDIEHIVIDGGSTDHTLQVINSHGPHVAKLVSEKDQGIYDAMNKGIALASGDIIGFINADDFYPTSLVASKVVEILKDPDLDACYGDLCYVGQENTAFTVRYWKSSVFLPGAFEAGWCPPHPTFFVRRSVYQRFGTFNLNYKIAADVELMMRLMEVHKIRSHYIPEVMVHMRMGGTTNRSLGNIVKQNVEILKALSSHGLRASILRLIGRKFISRGRQFLTRPAPAVK